MESFKSSNNTQWSVHGIPAFQDNYLWAIVHDPSHCLFIVDPGCAQSVQSFLDANGYHLSGILVTHHHPDHVGGIEQLLNRHGEDLPVYGPASGRIAQVNCPRREGDAIDVLGLGMRVLEVPGHTSDHVAYVAEFGSGNSDDVWIFCGDTLFSAGCGRLFEGSAEQMFDSLQKLNQFPAHSLVFCAHEYTASNLRFAQAMAPESSAIAQRALDVAKIRNLGMSTIPTSLGIERLSNLFINAKNPLEFKALREAKDRF